MPGTDTLADSLRGTCCAAAASGARSARSGINARTLLLRQPVVVAGERHQATCRHALTIGCAALAPSIIDAVRGCIGDGSGARLTKRQLARERSKSRYPSGAPSPSSSSYRLPTSRWRAAGGDTGRCGTPDKSLDEILTYVRLSWDLSELAAAAALSPPRF
jgi:hypothetical protein